MSAKMPIWMEGLEEYDVVVKRRLRSCGFIAPDECEIWIKYSLPFEEKLKTLIHELLHFYYDEILQFSWRAHQEIDEEDFIEEQTHKKYKSLTADERGLLEIFLKSSEAA